MEIDFRSDTFTKPTPAMLEAMWSARVGDDVFGEDPTVNELEAKLAKMFGMEAALFCPTGTMTNQIAIKCHTQLGNEVICERSSHVYIYEGAGIAFNSGCQVKPIYGTKGQLTASQIKEEINPDDVHKAETALVCLENTSNRGGGSCYDIQEITRIRKLCKDTNLKLHLDGARLFNALVAKNELPESYGMLFDSISICLSKGLGAPIGSVLLGSSTFIAHARRVRKVLGGGMRQVGYMAAAGIYALDNHIQRLHIDHSNAQLLSAALNEKDFVKEILPVETNILIFTVHGKYCAESFVKELKEKNIKLIPISPTQVRMVTHLDISSSMMDCTIETIKSL